MDYFTLSINLIEYMKLFIYQNNWNFISIAKIHMLELKKKSDVNSWEKGLKETDSTKAIEVATYIW